MVNANNMNRAWVSGAGGGTAEDCQSQGAAFSVYRTRGIIDLNENRLPNANDVRVAITEPILGYDAFVVSGGGTPVSGVNMAAGVTALNPGDYLVYLGGTVTSASSWWGIVNSNNATTGLNPNMQSPYFVRIVGTPGGTEGAS